MIEPSNYPVKHVECGPRIMPLVPTWYLRLDYHGHLEQWFEASCTIDGIVHARGEWRRIPMQA